MTSRRALIQGLLLILGVDPFGPLGRLWGRAHGGSAWAASRFPASKLDAGSLSSQELEDLVAFGEVLVEGRSLLPDERRHLVDHIEYRISRDPYYLSLYRTTVGLIDRLARTPFSSLDVSQRVEVMTRHRLTSAMVGPDEPLGPFPDDARLVRTRAVPDLIGGYYASPAGWAAVGYRAFPGVCSDLDRYTRPER